MHFDTFYVKLSVYCAEELYILIKRNYSPQLKKKAIGAEEYLVLKKVEFISPDRLRTTSS